MHKKSLTMADIARISGYSRMTVSMVLNNKPGVSARARRIIQEVVQTHHYSPNHMATALRGKPSRLIGVVVRDIGNPYYSQIIAGIETVMDQAGYTLLNISTHESHHREEQALRTLLSYQVDGLILAPVLRGVHFEHVNLFARKGKPIITFERVPECDVNYIDFEDVRGAYMATETLIRHGHRRIRHLAGPVTSKSAADRSAGFQRCCQDYGLGPEVAWAAPCGSASADGYRVALELLRQEKDRPTALFAFSDLVAIGAYRAVQSLGLRIPHDVSIIGYDDIDLAAVLGPSLTTISFSITRVGQVVARRMLRLIESGKPRDQLSRVLQPRLIERESVCAIGPAGLKGGSK